MNYNISIVLNQPTTLTFSRTALGKFLISFFDFGFDRITNGF